MTRFDRVLLAVPTGWRNRTIRVLQAPTPGTGGFHANVTITSEPWDGRSLEALMQDFKKELVGVRLPQLKLGAQKAVVVGGCPSIDLELWHAISHKNNLVLLARRQIIVLDEDTTHTFALAVAAEDYEESDAQIQTLLSSIVFERS